MSTNVNMLHYYRQCCGIIFAGKTPQEYNTGVHLMGAEQIVQRQPLASQLDIDHS